MDKTQLQAAGAERETDLIDGRLLRSDRQLLIIVIAAALFLIAISLTSSTGWIQLLLLLTAVALMAYALVSPNARSEFIRFALHEDGLTLIRSNGETQRAPWRMFESVLVRQKHRLMPTMDDNHWRITLMNLYRPSIGVFLHAERSAETIFMFPLIVDIRGDADEIDNLRRRVQASIDGAQLPDVFHREPASIDRESLLRLDRCVRCDYLLQGLPATNDCPECGWSFDERMFIAGYESISPSMKWLMILPVAVLAGLPVAVYFGPLTALVVTFLSVTGVVIGRSHSVLRTIRPQAVPRVLATAEGLEIWKHDWCDRSHRYRDLAEFQIAEGSEGDWQAAGWGSLPWTAYYSRFFDCWRSLPFPPTVRLRIGERGRTGKIIAEELERRYQAVHGRKPDEPATSNQVPRQGRHQRSPCPPARDVQ